MLTAGRVLAWMYMFFFILGKLMVVVVGGGEAMLCQSFSSESA